MERVLLAVDGMKASRRALCFAVDLCKSLKVNLSVLQVIDYRRYREYLRKLQDGSARVRRLFEGSMMAATFAEAGEHEVARQLITLARKNADELLSEFDGTGVKFSLEVKSGQPVREVVSYVNQHRNVVVTIYDVNDEDNGQTNRALVKQVFKTITERISGPLVVMHA